MRSLLLLACLVLSSAGGAQVDPGLSAGYYFQQINAHRSKGSAYAEFTNVSDGPKVSVFARTGHARNRSLLFSAEYCQYAFHLKYHNGGQGAGFGADVDVRMSLIYLGCAFEFFADSKRKNSVLVGVQAGLKYQCLATGANKNYGPGANFAPYDNSDLDDLRGDIRIQFGARVGLFRMGNWNSFLSPLANVSITSMLKRSPGSTAIDFGLSLGVVRDRAN